MYKTTVTIKFGEEISHEVTAYGLNETPSLVAHKAVTKDGKVHSTWSITHTASGLHVQSDFRTRKDAVTMIQFLEGIEGTDWSKETPTEIGVGPEIIGQMKTFRSKEDI